MDGNRSKYFEEARLSDLVGKTIEAITLVGKDALLITTSGVEFGMWHDQDCCEQVHLEDYDLEDLQWLVGQKVISLTEETNSENPLDPGDESFTWTFYKLVCEKDSVTLRWYGTSSGYYGEGVQFFKKVGYFDERERWEYIRTHRYLSRAPDFIAKIGE